MEEKIKAMSMDELLKKRTEVIEISPFTGNEPIKVEVKRLSIMNLCSRGVIPDPLLGAAKDILLNQELKSEKMNVNEYSELIDIICKETLVAPSFEEFERNMPLTDVQRSELYVYSQGGIDTLKSFRAKYASDTDSDNEQEVQDEAESTN